MTNVDRIPASVEWACLQDALATTTPGCAGDGRFVSDGRSRALTDELAALCAPCPIFDQCRGYATKMGPYRLTGFWAGRWRGKPRADDR